MRSPRHLHIRNVWEHSPTPEKIIELASIKDRGAVCICVTAPIYYQGPLTRGPFTCRPPYHMAPLTGVHVDPRGLLPRVRATCALRGLRAALPRGLSAALHPRAGLARHVSLRSPHHPRGPWINPPPLFAILIRKINKNQFKIR